MTMAVVDLIGGPLCEGEVLRMEIASQELPRSIPVLRPVRVLGKDVYVVGWYEPYGDWEDVPGYRGIYQWSGWNV